MYVCTYVLLSGIGQAGQQVPFPLTGGSTESIRYYMTRKKTSIVYYKKYSLIKYVPSLGETPATRTWQILDIDSQP